MTKKKTQTAPDTNGEQCVAILGLGYVGLSLAVRAQERGYDVIGYEPNKQKVDLINKQVVPFEEEYLEENLPKYPVKATTNEESIAKADIILICVPTPVDEFQNPVYDYVIQSSKMAAKHMKKGALVILESTVNPGVSEEIVRPIFEEAGYVVGQDVFIAHCPERVDPGKSTFSKGYDITNIPRCVGAFTKEGTKRAVAFYESIIDGEIRAMRSIREAEATKIVENSFRDINIAFVNELAQSFDRLGIDIKDVIDGAATKPYAFMAHYPSCGVGGHCIPVDPYYLIERAKKNGFDHKFMRRARSVNNYMPYYTVERMQDALNDIKLPMNGTKIGLMGLAYKPNVDDMRESPAIEVLKHLKHHKADVVVFDPHVPDQSDVETLEELLKKVDALILVTNHDEFLEMDLSLLKEHDIKVIIDGKNCLDKEKIQEMNIVYKGIGR